jgi:hypothetical protein
MFGLPTRRPYRSGSLVPLEEKIASSSPTLDLASWHDDRYDDYRISFLNLIPATDAVDLYMRMSVDGATYDASAIYHWAGFAWVSGGAGAGGVTVGAPAAQINLTLGNVLDNSVNWGYCGELGLSGPAAARYKIVNGQVSWFRNTDNNHVGGVIQGAYMSAARVRGLRFLMSSGNIASGIVRVYGVAK